MVGYVERTYFNPNSFSWKKDLPPVAEIAKKILEEKKNQTNSQALKRKIEQDKKDRLNDTMVAFTDNILPPADGCHPSITIGNQSSKIKRFDTFNPLQRGTGPGTATDGETMITMPSMDEENDDDDEDDDLPPFAPEVDEDGTKHYTTADGKKTLSYKKNAPQNGKLYRFSCNQFKRNM